MKGAGSKRLTMKYYRLLSNFLFKFNLRRYTMDNYLSFDSFAKSSVIVLQVMTIDGTAEQTSSCF